MNTHDSNAILELPGFEFTMSSVYYSSDNQDSVITNATLNFQCIGVDKNGLYDLLAECDDQGQSYYNTIDVQNKSQVTTIEGKFAKL